MKIKDLKELIEKIPDDFEICIRKGMDLPKPLEEYEISFSKDIHKGTY